MQLLPMASSPDGLISARDAVITKAPGWEVLTTTSDAIHKGGGGVAPGAPARRAPHRGCGVWGEGGGGSAKGDPADMPPSLWQNRWPPDARATRRRTRGLSATPPPVGGPTLTFVRGGGTQMPLPLAKRGGGHRKDPTPAALPQTSPHASGDGHGPTSPSADMVPDMSLPSHTHFDCIRPLRHATSGACSGLRHRFGSNAASGTHTPPLPDSPAMADGHPQMSLGRRSITTAGGGGPHSPPPPGR